MHPRITELTSSQLGLVTREQLGDLGLRPHNVRHLVASERLVWMTPRVLALVGIPISDSVHALCAALDARAVLSFDSAAALWGAPGYELHPAHVTRLRGGRVRSSHHGIVHEPVSLLPEHLTTFRNIPVMRPARLLFDLAATTPSGRLERTLDWMWSHRLVTIPALDRTLAQVAVRGRKGIVAMRKLIEPRRGQAPYGSGLESRFHRIVHSAGLPPFDRQVDLGDHHEWIGRIDFVSTTRLLVIEIDSEVHHSALSDRRRDAQQRQQLESAGFMVRVLDERDLFGPQSYVIKMLRRWYSEATPRVHK